MGGLLGTIHGVRREHFGRLSRESSPSWGGYFGRRMRRRLEPHARDGLLSYEEMNSLAERAAAIELDQPRLLHVDFRAARSA